MDDIDWRQYRTPRTCRDAVGHELAPYVPPSERWQKRDTAGWVFAGVVLLMWVAYIVYLTVKGTGWQWW